MVKVLLVGSGAREHALAETLIRSPQEVELYAFMGNKNPGIISLAAAYEIGNLDNNEAIISFASGHKADFAVIGPEKPLANGIVDELEKAGIKSIAPKKRLAQLESSKSFTRNLLEKYKIRGNPKFNIFTSTEGMEEFMKKLKGNFVVKADGLRSGKGVKVTGDHLKGIEGGLAYAKECISQDGRVIIEEKLDGEEFSLMFFADGKNLAMMPPCQDHKRAFADDKGPNTGGMGSYSCANHSLPFLRVEDIIEAKDITKRVLNAMRLEFNEEYKGIMYGGFMVSRDGIRLIEYNARFGDPEAMNVLPILKTDFIEVCNAILNRSLDELNVEFSTKATVCKYVVPEGYPENPAKGKMIDISDVSEDAKVYFADVDERDDGLYTGLSRAVALVGIAENFEEAEKVAQEAASQVKGKVYFRNDIGTKALIDRRIRHMQELRG